jgi:glycosyltransferase involved in cell wall biosynthesis
MFSVLVPVFEHAGYVTEAVISALRSPLVGEVLLCDDGSTDGSREVVARLAASHARRVRDLSDAMGGRNLGAAARLNQLARAAHGDWLAVLNSDDRFVPGRFEAVEVHVRRGDISFVFGHLLVMDERGRVTGTKKGILQPEYPFPSGIDVETEAARGEVLDLLASQNFIATTSNMVFTRALYERVGGFREFRYVHDWDFALRAALLGRARCIPQFLAIYRDHPRNTIKTRWASVSEEVRRVFGDLLAEFPELRDREGFRAALLGNGYLSREELPERATLGPVA